MREVARVAHAIRNHMPDNRHRLNVEREVLEGGNRCLTSLHE